MSAITTPPARGTLCAIFAGCFVACGPDDPTEPVTDDAPSFAGLESPSAGAGQQLGMRARVDAGVETTLCRFFEPAAGAPASLEVSRFTHRYTGGSHHMILYQTGLEPAAVTDWDVFDCTSGEGLSKSGVLYAAQDPKGEITWPEGVAVEVAQGAVSLMEWHVINTKNTAEDVEVGLNLHYSREPASQYAGTLFYYDYFIYLPPEQTATAKMRCEAPSDFTMMWSSSHMHRRGVAFRSRLLESDLTLVRNLFETADWDEPGALRFEEGLQVRAGQVIEYECDFENTTAEPIIEGPSAVVHEMCMFVGGYYPRFEVDLAENCYAGSSGPVFNGTQSCAESLACIMEHEDPALPQSSNPERERCWVETSEASGVPLVDLLLKCRLQTCGSTCPQGALATEECQACLADLCATQLDACNAAPGAE